jgi:photosystem II stability/assembly factor-like uncharacterized protein
MRDRDPGTRRAALAALTWPVLAPLAACGGGGGDAPAPPPPPPTEPRFTAHGLAGHIVRRLRPSPGGWLAATGNGAFRHTAAGWQPLGLTGQVVLDIVAPDATTLIASVHTANAVPRDFRLVESRDAGASWQALMHDFGGPHGPEGVHALAFDGAANRLLATGADVLAESTDRGRRWRRLAGDWHAFTQPKEALAIDPRRGDAWYGGQDAIEGFALFRHRAASGSLVSHPGLMPNPSVAKGIRFALEQPQRVIVAGEGGLVQTLDDGASWQRLLDTGYRFHFDVLQDPQRPQRWVSASWAKNFDTPQPLIVHITDDDGRSWRTLQHPDRTLFGGAWSMAASLENGRTVYDFGLYKGGVMRLELP